MKKSELPAVVVALQVRLPAACKAAQMTCRRPAHACWPPSLVATLLHHRHLKLGVSPPLLQPLLLQDAGLLISRKDHGAHHKAPFNEKYSIVSGWCNPLLDGDCPGERRWLLCTRAGGAAGQRCLWPGAPYSCLTLRHMTSTTCRLTSCCFWHLAVQRTACI